MTEEQRAHLERRLLEERDRARESLERFNARAREGMTTEDGDLTNVPLHMADQGTDAQDQEVDFSLAARQSEVLRRIDEALRRLYGEPERFGMCDGCDREIPFERLDLVPWAHECEDCEDAGEEGGTAG